MPTVDVAKIKIRRGSNTDRKLIILDSGELGYTIDTNRVYIGNGNLKGGSSVGTFNFNNSTRSNISVKNKAEVGDLVFENYVLYSLSGTDATSSVSWTRLTPNVDGTTIQYNTDYQLEVITSGIVTAGDGIAVVGSTVSINYNSDANTDRMFIPGVDAALQVNPNGALTNNSHGALDYKPDAGAANHHTLAVAAASGSSAADGFFSKENAQKLWYAPEWDNYTSTSGSTSEQIGGNRTITVINDGTLKINPDRLNFATAIAGTASIARTMKKDTGQGPSTLSSNISAVDMMTPWNSFNREDIPGSILRTSMPAANIDNKGEYANFTITNVGADPSQWPDRAFLLPGGDGVIYGIFIQSTTTPDPTPFADAQSKYPMVTWTSVNYDASGATIRLNIIGGINGITNTNGERIFDAWQKLDLSEATVYIQGLVKGKTPPYAVAFAQTNLEPSSIRVGQSTPVVFSNTVTSIDYDGGTPTTTSIGNNAGNGTTGKVGVGMYGWVCLNTYDNSTFQQTLCSTGFKAKHTIAQFAISNEITTGEYFLIYDANYNRHCVFYTVGGAATVTPDISNNEIHRGRKTNFIEVVVAAGLSKDDVGQATSDALVADLEF